MEIRSFATPVSVEGKKRRIVGVIPYNSDSHVLTENGRKFIERIAPGAFNRSIETGDITAWFTHDELVRPPLGRTSAGTLRLSGNDEIGLRVWIDAPTSAADVVEAVERGDVRGFSFMFSDPVYDWNKSGQLPVGTIREARLKHVALVVNPAYPAAHAAVRSHVEIPLNRLAIAEKEMDLLEIILRMNT
jgi:HK97 family phage prohead protease